VAQVRLSHDFRTAERAAPLCGGAAAFAELMVISGHISHIALHSTIAHQKSGKRTEKIRRPRNRSILFPLSAIPG
jgi:hypothetical protein